MAECYIHACMHLHAIVTAVGRKPHAAKSDETPHAGAAHIIDADAADRRHDRITGRARLCTSTTVEVCRRAGVTRGALLHHFEDLSALFEASLEWLYDDMGRSGAADAPMPHDARRTVHRADVVRRRARGLQSGNRDLAGGAQRHGAGAASAGGDQSSRRDGEPGTHPDIRRLFGGGARAISYFLLVRETMIGMALGRAVTPGGELGHERRVLDLLAALAPSPKVSRSSI